MSHYSDSAKAYAQVQQRDGYRSATWMDVAAAYDAGMQHALEARRNAIKQARRLRDRCAVCGFAEDTAIHISTHLHGKRSPGGLKYHEFKPSTTGATP